MVASSDATLSSKALHKTSNSEFVGDKELCPFTENDVENTVIKISRFTTKDA
jgi:hypothetical protein